MKPWKHRCRVSCKSSSEQNIRSPERRCPGSAEVCPCLQTFANDTKTRHGLHKWLWENESNLAERGEPCIHLPIQRAEFSYLWRRIWAHLHSKTSHLRDYLRMSRSSVFLWAHEEKLARTLLLFQRVIDFCFMSQKSRRRVWAHLALSSRVSRTLPHGTDSPLS